MQFKVTYTMRHLTPSVLSWLQFKFLFQLGEAQCIKGYVHLD